MTTEQYIGLGIALAVMFLGLAGNFIPGLAGTPLVLAGAVGHRLYFGAASVSNAVLLALLLLALLALLLDYLATMLGAKKFGASWRGVAGAVIGGIIGLFFALPGIILGPFLGAILFELLGRREFKEAARAGAGAVVGLLLGVVGKCSVCVIMIGLFTTSVLLRSGD